MDRLDFLREYGSFGKESDAAGVWELVHRLDEMDEYIQCVELMYACLNNAEIRSEGLLALKEYVGKLYTEGGFEELKKDISALKVDASKVKSITLGVNLNDRYEPVEVGIVSINGKTFSKSSVISNFLWHREAFMWLRIPLPSALRIICLPIILRTKIRRWILEGWERSRKDSGISFRKQQPGVWGGL